MDFYQVKFFILVIVFFSLNLKVFGCVRTDDNCPNENITFWLYKNETSSTPTLLDLSKLSHEEFQPKRPLAILIHGYTGHKDYSPNTQIRPVLLQEKNSYVISVDYNPLVQDPCYTEAVYNLKSVSRCLGQLINSLLDQNTYELEDIHVIGFSLGAHVAGMTANFVTRKLKRITGLDPAKPLFIFANNENKLDPSDAEFVDVIHTDILGRGLFGPNGHVDFYPNSGFNQPGCVEEAPDSVGSCNHNRAPAYYAESINPLSEFIAYQCPNWFQCMIGQYPWAEYSEYMIMGYDIPQKSKSLTDLKRLEPDNDFLADNLEKIIFSSKKRFKKDSKKFVEKNIAELDDIAKGIASDAENNQRIANNYKTQFNKFHLASVNLNATIDNFIKVNRANAHNVSIATCSILDRTSNMKEDIKKLLKNNYNSK